MQADVHRDTTQECAVCGKTAAACQCATRKVSAEDQWELLQRDQAQQAATSSQATDIVEGRYRILEKVGTGGMGTVYRAQHVVLYRQVAIKILRTELLSDSQAMARFEQEARACAALSHNNLVSVYDCGVTDRSQPFLVMEFLSGRNLFDLIKQDGALSLKSFLDIFIEVCKGLSYAHSQGVIHRDLKPSNIILTRDSLGVMVPKVVDFGVAKIEDLGGEFQMLTRTGEVFGSPAYMSPEQCQGKVVDQRTDIYALGCVMYEAISGKPAFKGHNIMTIMTKQMEDIPARPVPPSKDITAPTQLIDAIMTCLNKNPDNRYRSIDELQKVLESVREGLLGRSFIKVGTLQISSEVFLSSTIAIAVLCLVVLYPVLLPGGQLNDYFGAFRQTSKSGTSPATAALLAAYADRLDMHKFARRNYEDVLKNKRGASIVDRLLVAAIMMEQMDDRDQYDKLLKFYASTAEPLAKELEGAVQREPHIAETAGQFVPLIYCYVANAQVENKYYQGAEAASSSGLKYAKLLKSPDWIVGKVQGELGHAYYKGDRYEKAVQPLSIALDLMIRDSMNEELESEIYEATNDLAKSFIKLKQPEKAISVLELTLNYQIETRSKKDHARKLLAILVPLCQEFKKNNVAEKLSARLMAMTDESKKSKNESLPADVKIANAPYPVLLDRSIWMRFEGFWPNEKFDAPIDRAKQEGASDVEICAVAASLLREYTDRDTTHCEALFKKVKSAVERLKSKMEKRDPDKPAPYVGSAPMVYCYMTRSSIDLGRYQLAEEYARTGLSLCDGQPDGVWMSGRLHQVLGQSLIELGKFAEAEQALKLSLKELKTIGGETNPWVAECYYNIAIVYFRTNRLAESKQAYEKACAILRPNVFEEWRINIHFKWLKEQLDKAQ